MVVFRPLPTQDSKVLPLIPNFFLLRRAVQPNCEAILEGEFFPWASDFYLAKVHVPYSL